jgi:hypothetical protein
MSDDLFEFLAGQEMARAAEEARCAAEDPQRPAEVRPIIDEIKGKAQLGRTAKVRACQPDECDWALGNYTTQLDAISRYETVLFTDMLFRRSAGLLV